jgi:hypothetical protein
VGPEYWVLEIYSNGKLCHYRSVAWSRGGACAQREAGASASRYSQLQSSCFDEVKGHLRTSLEWVNTACGRELSRVFLTGPFKQIQHLAKAVTLAAEVPTVIWVPRRNSADGDVDWDESHARSQVEECCARRSVAREKDEYFSVEPKTIGKEAAGALGFIAGQKWLCLTLFALGFLDALVRSAVRFEGSASRALEAGLRPLVQQQSAGKALYAKAGAVKSFQANRAAWAKILSDFQRLPREGLIVRRRIGVLHVSEPRDGSPVTSTVTLAFEGVTISGPGGLESTIDFLQTQFPGAAVELKRIGPSNITASAPTSDFSIVCSIPGGTTK